MAARHGDRSGRRYALGWGAVGVRSASMRRRGDENMLSDDTRQHRAESTDPVRTCHPHIVAVGHKRNRTARLYPEVL